MRVPILLCLIILIKKSITNQSYIIIHPERQIAKINNTITLQCRVKVVDKLEVHWIKDGFGLGNSRADIRQYGKPVNNNFRYDLPFNLNEGEYDLRITDLELSDEGVFYCQVVVDGLGYSSEKATVQVLVSSSPPKLIQRSNQGAGPKEEKSIKNPIIVNDGEELVIDCITKHGRPGAKLFWFINDRNVEKQKTGGINGTFSGEIIVSISQSKKSFKLYNSLSTLKMKINNLIHGNLLKCVAENSGFDTDKLKAAVAKIEVHTIPIVKMESNPSREKIEFLENDVVEFTCKATGRPNTFTWKWYVDDKLVENIIVNKYKVRINRSMHKSNLKCAAMSTREGFISTTILVKYGPKFLNENYIMYAASLGENVEMSCKTDSNPESSISWQRESNEKIISQGTSLIHKNIKDDDFGIYICTATTSGFPSVFKKAYLARKKPPIIMQPSVIYGREGKSARLSCSIESVPLPRDSEIKWMYQNKEISKSNRHKTYQEAFIGGVVAILQIISLSNDDFGDYNCSVNTSLGSANGVVILLSKGETHILMIVGASIILLFILLVTTVVLCICKKKKYKSDYEKGNPSSPDIPVHHDAKSTLIDSDCHCNPNLYSWIPQTLDLKENRGLLNKVHNQEENLWSKANDMETSYSNSLANGYLTKKSIQMNEIDHVRSNPLVFNLPNNILEHADFNKYSSNFPFATLSISGNPNNNACEQSQCPHYMYQEFCPNINVQIPSNIHSNDVPSHLYMMKKPFSQNQRQFPLDVYPTSKSMINPQIHDSFVNSNNRLMSDYASNI